MGATVVCPLVFRTGGWCAASSGYDGGWWMVDGVGIVVGVLSVAGAMAVVGALRCVLLLPLPVVRIREPDISGSWVGWD